MNDNYAIKGFAIKKYVKVFISPEHNVVLYWQF